MPKVRVNRFESNNVTYSVEIDGVQIIEDKLLGKEFTGDRRLHSTEVFDLRKLKIVILAKDSVPHKIGTIEISESFGVKPQIGIRYQSGCEFWDAKKGQIRLIVNGDL